MNHLEQETSRKSVFTPDQIAENLININGESLHNFLDRICLNSNLINLFVTGAPGTGKTTLVEITRKYFQNRPDYGYHVLSFDSIRSNFLHSLHDSTKSEFSDLNPQEIEDLRQYLLHEFTAPVSEQIYSPQSIARISEFPAVGDLERGQSVLKYFGNLLQQGNTPNSAACIHVVGDTRVQEKAKKTRAIVNQVDNDFDLLIRLRQAGTIIKEPQDQDRNQRKIINSFLAMANPEQIDRIQQEYDTKANSLYDTSQITQSPDRRDLVLLKEVIMERYQISEEHLLMFKRILYANHIMAHEYKFPSQMYMVVVNPYLGDIQYF